MWVTSNTLMKKIARPRTKASVIAEAIKTTSFVQTENELVKRR
jgi:hypothetical protein